MVHAIRASTVPRWPLIDPIAKKKSSVRQPIPTLPSVTKNQFAILHCCRERLGYGESNSNEFCGNHSTSIRIPPAQILDHVVRTTELHSTTLDNAPPPREKTSPIDMVILNPYFTTNVPGQTPTCPGTDPGVCPGRLFRLLSKVKRSLYYEL